MDVVVWAKKRIFPKNRMDCKGILKMMGLPDYNAWEIVKRTNACRMEDPYWLRFSEEETFADTTRGRSRKIMSEIKRVHRGKRKIRHCCERPDRCSGCDREPPQGFA